MQIVVNAANRHGLYMFLIVSKSMLNRFFHYLHYELSILTTICTVIDSDKIKINIMKFDEITVTLIHQRYNAYHHN